MPGVVVPVRYPLSDYSRATLFEAADVARDRDAALTVLHVDLYQNEGKVTRRQLKDAVERAFGKLPDVRYVVRRGMLVEETILEEAAAEEADVVRRGMLVEETILEEAAAEEADVVVIGKKQAGRWQRMIRRVVDDPDIEDFLGEELDCRVLTVSPQ